MLYAGPLVAFAVLICLVPRIPGLSLHAAVRSYRAWGPGLGLSLGACILGGLWGHWQDTGGFQWSIDTLADRWAVATHAVFVVAWVSNIVLEIWTLEPLRRLDPDAPGPPADSPAYLAAGRHLCRHMAIHAVLLLGVAVLELSRRSL